MVIITGASDGLGKEIAGVFLENNINVLCLSRNKPTNDKVLWIQTDLLRDDSVMNSASEILKVNRTIELLVNCAAITSYEDINDLSAIELEKMFKINVTAPMLLTSKLLDRLKKDKGDIINIGATIALKSGYANQSVYSATKWALRGFTQNLSDNLKNSSTRVISVLLGGFNSNMHKKVTGIAIPDPENWMDPKEIAKLIYQIYSLPKNMEVSEIIVNQKSRR